MIKFSSMKYPFGRLFVASTERGVCLVLTRPSGKRFKKDLRKESDQEAKVDHRALRPVMEQFREYFAGKRKEFDVSIDILKGTKFQRCVWKRLEKIPFGEVSTYGQIARAVGLPGGARAVGQANARNPVSIIVPCHRVVAAGGKIGGYGGGLKMKRHLLELEGSWPLE